MIVSIDGEKKHWTKLTPFHDEEKIQKLEYKETTYLNIIKATYEKPTLNITLNSKRLKNFFSEIWNKKRIPAFITSIQCSTSSGQSN